MGSFAGSGWAHQYEDFAEGFVMRHVVTLIAPRALRAQTALLARARAMLNPVRVVWLSEFACDFEMDNAPPELAYRTIAAMADVLAVDCVLQPLEHRAKRLLISDMDSTMIDQECIDELADFVGKKTQVSAITARAMNGELDFAAALKERVALLKGLPETTLTQALNERITPMAGAVTLLATMKARGAYALLVSGGFTFFTTAIAARLGFDAQEANVLEVSEGRLTGTVRAPILGKEAKRASLLRIATGQRIPLSATLAVGDGANDLPMLQAAGLGVAYRAKPSVEAAAPARIRHNDVSALLYVQGIAKREWVTPCTNA